MKIKAVKFYVSVNGTRQRISMPALVQNENKNRRKRQKVKFAIPGGNRGTVYCPECQCSSDLILKLVTGQLINCDYND